MDESWSKIETLSVMEGIVNILDEIEEDTKEWLTIKLVNKNIGIQSDHKTTKKSEKAKWQIVNFNGIKRILKD